LYADAYFPFQEKLRFPSGTATAKVMRMLHGAPPLTDELDGNTAVNGPLLPVVEEVPAAIRVPMQIPHTQNPISTISQLI
jgi:uncharacterized oligopeptide transporter (OPT) family protein